MNKKVVTGMVLVLMFSTFSMCDNTKSWYGQINPELIKLTYYNYTTNDRLNGPSIISGDLCVILYDFTCEGLKEALNFSNDKSYITIDLPDKTMNVSGQHFKNSIFYVNGSHLILNGKGQNIVSSAYTQISSILGIYICFLSPFLIRLLKDRRIVERSKEDTVFVVDNIADNMSVFRFEGNNITVSGLAVSLKQNTSACTVNISCNHSCFSDLYVETS